MSDDEFYRDLPAFQNFMDAVDPANYAVVPSSWYVVITDVEGSTKAIDAGRYRDVNVLGAASIAAVLNAVGAHDHAYVFGGDGSTVVLSESQLERAIGGLLGLASLAESLFGLALRVGVVPVADLEAAGVQIRVAKYALSKHLPLAMFWGEGVGVAEAWVKDPDKADRYLRRPDADAPQPDVSGLNCRWEPIPARNGEMVSVLVAALDESDAGRARVYREVLEYLAELAGDLDGLRPAHQSTLQLSDDVGLFESEARLKSGKRRSLSTAAATRRAQAENIVGRRSFGSGKTVAGFDGPAYIRTLIAHTDFQKFDDTLRMVVDLGVEDHARLRAFLDDRREKGLLAFGTHAAGHALMTCLVWDHGTDHVHFIDGADGGYAMAAKELKAQLKDSKPT